MNIDEKLSKSIFELRNKKELDSSPDQMEPSSGKNDIFPNLKMYSCNGEPSHQNKRPRHFATNGSSQNISPFSSYDWSRSNISAGTFPTSNVDSLNTSKSCNHINSTHYSDMLTKQNEAREVGSISNSNNNNNNKGHTPGDNIVDNLTKEQLDLLIKLRTTGFIFADNEKAYDLLNHVFGVNESSFDSLIKINKNSHEVLVDKNDTEKLEIFDLKERMMIENPGESKSGMPKRVECSSSREIPSKDNFSRNEIKDWALYYTGEAMQNKLNLNYGSFTSFATCDSNKYYKPSKSESSPRCHISPFNSSSLVNDPENKHYDVCKTTENLNNTTSTSSNKLFPSSNHISSAYAWYLHQTYMQHKEFFERDPIHSLLEPILINGETLPGVNANLGNNKFCTKDKRLTDEISSILTNTLAMSTALTAYIVAAIPMIPFILNALNKSKSQNNGCECKNSCRDSNHSSDTSANDEKLLNPLAENHKPTNFDFKKGVFKHTPSLSDPHYNPSDMANIWMYQQELYHNFFYRYMLEPALKNDDTSPGKNFRSTNNCKSWLDFLKKIPFSQNYASSFNCFRPRKFNLYNNNDHNEILEDTDFNVGEQDNFKESNLLDEGTNVDTPESNHRNMPVKSDKSNEKSTAFDDVKDYFEDFNKHYHKRYDLGNCIEPRGTLEPELNDFLSQGEKVCDDQIKTFIAKFNLSNLEDISSLLKMKSNQLHAFIYQEDKIVSYDEKYVLYKWYVYQQKIANLYESSIQNDFANVINNNHIKRKIHRVMENSCDSHGFLEKASPLSSNSLEDMTESDANSNNATEIVTDKLSTVKAFKLSQKGHDNFVVATKEELIPASSSSYPSPLSYNFYQMWVKSNCDNKIQDIKAPSDNCKRIDNYGIQKNKSGLSPSTLEVQECVKIINNPKIDPIRNNNNDIFKGIMPIKGKISHLPYKRERFTFKSGHLEVLERFFKEDAYPDSVRREIIANACNRTIIGQDSRELMPREKVTTHVVANWFANRRKESRRQKKNQIDKKMEPYVKSKKLSPVKSGNDNYQRPCIDSKTNKEYAISKTEIANVYHFDNLDIPSNPLINHNGSHSLYSSKNVLPNNMDEDKQEAILDVKNESNLEEEMNAVNTTIMALVNQHN
ncbi:unnamed protein product [Gordionus sp. m RMFG-2023]